MTLGGRCAQDRIIDRETSTIYIIMEFCENGDLSSVIRKYAAIFARCVYL